MTSEPGNFSHRYGPWAVVTGASDGIGQAFARWLARKGLNLVLVARRESALASLAAELRLTHGTNCRVLALDMSAPAASKELADATADLDVGLLVAAAGFGTSGPLLDGPLAAEAEMVDLNCRAVVEQAWHFGQRMGRRGRGGVVLMSSLLAFQGTPRAAHYAATKAYVQTLAEGLRVEWAPLGVDVIASAPGPIRTGFAARANLRMAQALPAEVVARVTMRALGRKTTVRPGWSSKLLGWSLAALPRWGRVTIIAQVMKGMTAHQGRAAHRPSESRT
jgi:short-subunit dehydrogenase